ncbi:MAG: HAMP domain-containing histidine kinase [Dehalococcoidia bacterium]|jgi:two-component system, OmpR family, sensor histidine kinase PrrB|nr:HAMP domain-containing histidine kinase [Dehalococcoidia bacterium]
MSLRSRVALSSMAATIAVVVLLGVVLLALTERSQQDELDEALQQQVGIVVSPGPFTNLVEGRRVPRELRGFRSDLFVASRVINSDGSVFETVEFPEIPVPVAVGFSTESADGEQWRVLTMELPRPPGGGGAVLLQTTASMEGVESTLSELRRLILALGAFAVGAAGLGGWLLGTVAIRPLAGLRREAERVSETVDLSVRVPVDQGPSEVDELAQALNVMLERIEEGAAQTQAALDASRGFAGNVAHELRTPLTSMQTNLEVLAANPDLPVEERNAIVGDVVAQQHRLLDALEALRLLARGELAAADLFESTDLGELVDGTVAQAQARFPEATITLDVQREPPEVRVWPEGLRVLLDNLVRNAVTHGRPSGGGEAEVVVSLDHDEREWVLTVTDGGLGIAAADRERVFGRFERGNGVQGAGTGLGLALVAQQAAVHSGSVTIDDAPGGGARVTVRAPLDDVGGTSEAAS